MSHILILFAVYAITAISALSLFRIHNPHGVEVHDIHIVFSNHLDVGCKIADCGTNLPGEPNRCAITRVGRMGEPYAYHVINRYFDEFFPLAIANAKRKKNSTNVSYKYTWMTQPWLISLYLNCSNAGILSWEGLGAAHVGMSMIHCPNSSAIASMREALRRGDIYMHAFPHDGEAEYYPDKELFESALGIAKDIALDIGIPSPTAVSQRDVPGWSRASVPLLVKHGINGLSFGAGTPPGKPDVPPMFVWKDIASNTELVATYETAYGTENTIFVLPNGVALVASWYGDNRGPSSIDSVHATYDYLQKKFPQAHVHASTFDAFFKIANQPSVKSLLPIVTREIGDGWIFGIPSDPLKNSQFREATRQRAACIASGICNPSSAPMKAFDRLLVKVPEHTWGIAQTWFLPDYENYTNPQFDRARAQQSFGFVKNNSNHADYNTTVNSWIEQRTYVTSAPLLLQEKYSTFASNLTAALTELSNVSEPSDPLKRGFELIPNSDVTTRNFSCGDLVMSFTKEGSLSRLMERNNAGLGSHPGWANSTHTLGLYLYQTFTNEDYNIFLNDFAERLGDKGVWPNHTKGHSGCLYKPGDVDDLNCGNFRKPNITSAHPQRRAIHPQLNELWWKKSSGDDKSGPICEFVVNASLASEATIHAGAPKRIITTIAVRGKQLDFDVIAVNKRPTRLPESIFFSFNPALPGEGEWSVKVLGSVMNTSDVLGHIGADNNSTVYGGSPHLRGIESAIWRARDSNMSLTLTSLDVPIISLGEPSPFPSPRTGPPDLRKGLHWNIFQNIWNTNYILWYPFLPEDQNIRSRFHLALGSN